MSGTNPEHDPQRPEEESQDAAAAHEQPQAPQGEAETSRDDPTDWDDVRESPDSERYAAAQSGPESSQEPEREERTAVFARPTLDQRRQRPYGGHYGAEYGAGYGAGYGAQSGGQYGAPQGAQYGAHYGNQGGHYGARPAGPSYPPYGPDPGSPPPYAAQPGGFGPPTGPDERPHSDRPRRSRRAVGIMVAAVLAGALAGIGGSAGYLALNEPADESASPVSAPDSSNVADTDAPSGSVQAVADAVLPSVVKIDVAGRGGSGSGSGIVLTADGTIVTNHHVVAAAAEGGELAVSFNDGSTSSAEVVGTDPMTDLAVIKAHEADGLTPATLGRSGDVSVGEQVVAVGSPFGLESTVTSGIVSALDRPVTAGDGQSAEQTIFPAIQTDAAINPGNSGGALVNMRGEVVGINSAIRSTPSPGGAAGSIGLGFAIPVDEVKPIIDQITSGETVTHARLGVTVGTPSNEEGLPAGAEVAEVENGSAAAEAGLESGDVITKIDDHVISSSNDLVAMVRSYRPGDEVELEVQRGDDRTTVEVTLGSDEGDNNT